MITPNVFFIFSGATGKLKSTNIDQEQANKYRISTGDENRWVMKNFINRLQLRIGKRENLEMILKR